MTAIFFIGWIAFEVAASMTLFLASDDFRLPALGAAGMVSVVLGAGFAASVIFSIGAARTAFGAGLITGFFTTVFLAATFVPLPLAGAFTAVFFTATFLALGAGLVTGLTVLTTFFALAAAFLGAVFFLTSFFLAVGILTSLIWISSDPVLTFDVHLPVFAEGTQAADPASRECF
jgi:hypothetical protein